jgi:hypothetical protein
VKALCPQEYGPEGMRVTPCTRCNAGWDQASRTCTIPTGAEHLPLEPADQIPTCPIQDRCQHQVQLGVIPCPIRARGLICESALIESGLSPEDAASHPLGFNADCVASPEEVAEWLAEQGR